MGLSSPLGMMWDRTAPRPYCHKFRSQLLLYAMIVPGYAVILSYLGQVDNSVLYVSRSLMCLCIVQCIVFTYCCVLLHCAAYSSFT